MIILFLIYIAVYSTLLYYYLHKKTHISIGYLYKDNLINIVLSCLITYAILQEEKFSLFMMIFTIFFIVPVVCVFLTLTRFYRVPFRKTNLQNNAIVSPADGNIIYIKKIEAGNVPISVKNGRSATLNEFVNTGILDFPCWLIGINMTPFDVHRNCAPADGQIILNKHFNGTFLSLKHENALLQNERNTIIINNPKGKIGVVQTASRLVRRIVTYKSVGEYTSKGEWIGMIKFGSQVDLIIPATCKVNTKLKQQVYAKKTVIAEW